MLYKAKKYVAEFVYGGIDGTVTTFAVVSGAVGASLSPTVILILGFANLFADGFSMAVSNYLSTKSERDLDRSTGKQHLHNKLPRKTAAVTFIAFVGIGIIPLISFVIAPFHGALEQNKFIISTVLTGIAFFCIGGIKGKVTETGIIKSAFITLLIGSIAAVIAYAVGYFLRGIVGT